MNTNRLNCMHVGRGEVVTLAASNSGLEHAQFIGVCLLKLFGLRPTLRGVAKFARTVQNVAKPTRYFSNSTTFDVGAFRKSICSRRKVS
jgi:hypothetical protein